MKAFLLDTDMCIYAMKQKHGVLDRLLKMPRASIHVSIVTECELRFGAAKSVTSAKATRALEAFLAPLQVIDLDGGDAVCYAQVRAKLEKAGTPIGPLDTFIAAQAVARKMTLVTNNEREFARVHGLHLENWAVEGL
jgi:tRNA(fMet)-specific endonuclease VapC